MCGYQCALASQCQADMQLSLNHTGPRAQAVIYGTACSVSLPSWGFFIPALFGLSECPIGTSGLGGVDFAEIQQDHVLNSCGTLDFFNLEKCHFEISCGTLDF